MYNKDYLTMLIHERLEETLFREYKAADALIQQQTKTKDVRTEISKDVSAFANSDGGIIIYGLKEDPKDRRAVSLDPIDSNLISKEWLEQVIQSRIQPRIGNIRIHPIQIDDRKNGVVYVIEIPKSTTAHQAYDQRYYRRYNFVSVPMQDYEIRDVFNRAKHPQVIIEFSIDEYEGQRGCLLRVIARNVGVIMAKYVNCKLSFRSDILEYEFDFDEYQTGKVEISCDNTVRDRIGDTYGTARYVPLLPSLSMELSLNPISLKPGYRKLQQQIYWEVYADNAEPMTGHTMIKSIKANHY